MTDAEKVFDETRFLLSTSPPVQRGKKWAISSLLAKIWSSTIPATREVLCLINKGMDVLDTHGTQAARLPSGVRGAAQASWAKVRGMS